MRSGYRVDENSAADPNNSSNNKMVETFSIPFKDKAIICERRIPLQLVSSKGNDTIINTTNTAAASSSKGKSTLKPNKSQSAGWSKSEGSKSKLKHSNGSTPDLIFTHGAGGGLSNPATASFAEGFAQISPMAAFQGTMNLSNRVATFHAVIRDVAPTTDTTPALGGRSMGARAAVITAAEIETHSQSDEVDKVDSKARATPSALILVSYPLTSPKGEVRDDILLRLPASIDVLFVTGTTDTMCDIAHLRRVRMRMKAHSWLCCVIGADHGMSVKVTVPRSKSGATSAAMAKSKANTGKRKRPTTHADEADDTEGKNGGNKKGEKDARGEENEDPVEAIRKTTGQVAAAWLAQRNRSKTYCEISLGLGLGEHGPHSVTVVRGEWVREGQDGSK